MADTSTPKPASPLPPQDMGPNWEALFKQVREERDRLRMEVENLVKERDLYRAALQASLAADETPFSKDEVLAQLAKGKLLKDVIGRLESQLSS